MIDQEACVTLYDLFRDSVKLHPNRVAVLYDDGTTTEQISYQKVSEQAEKIASGLPVTSENEIIALYCRQFAGLPACILGVLHAGSAFAPIDLNLPPRLIVEFLTKLHIRIVLVDIELALAFQKVLSAFPIDHGSQFQGNPELLQTGFCLVKIYPYFELPRMEYTRCRIPTGNPCRFAYVMQTSGTTGGPKTVMAPHKCIVPNIDSLRNMFKISCEDVVFLASPYTFDPSVVQMFLALSSGSALSIVPESLKMMPTKLANVLFERQKVTILQLTSSLMYSFGSEVIKSKILNKDTSLRVLAFGGEESPPVTTLRHWKCVGCKTEFYNLYGITEVSSWATCHHIKFSEEELSSSKDCVDAKKAERMRDEYNFSEQAMLSVPLGVPLLDTLVEVRDRSGNVLTEGIGQLFIGGKKRVCLLEGETSLSEGTFRASGDWAYIKDETIWYCGRTDRQIKRYGKQLNLSQLEHIISRSANKAQCCVIPRRLPSEAHGPSHVLLHAFILCNDGSLSTAAGLEKLNTKLKQLLPHHAVPDSLEFVTSFPVTSHGKINMKALLDNFSKNNHRRETLEVRRTLGYLWITSLQGSVLEIPRVFTLLNTEVKSCYDVKDQEEFISNGGTSMQAVSLANQIENWVNSSLATEHHMAMTALVDIILNKTFGDLAKFVTMTMTRPFEEQKSSLKKYSGKEETASLPQKKLKDEETKDAVTMHIKTDSRLNFVKRSSSPQAVQNGFLSEIIKQQHKKLKVSHSVDADVMMDCFCSFRRGSQETVCRFCKVKTPVSVGLKSKQTGNILCNRIGTTNLLSKLLWQRSLFKCIDASPLVVWSCKRGSEGEVFIGSHAHVFMAVSLTDGSVIWETTLGDRIESSAVLSQCGTFVIVGCYDGKVYFLKRETGVIVWYFKTRGPVKSSPCVDGSTGLVWVGSHDHYLYALDPLKREGVAAIDCKSGSVFSSPVVSHEPAHLVYAATLGGRIVAVDPYEGLIIWSYQLPKPVFASPAVTLTGVLVASTNKTVYSFDSTGRIQWTFCTEEPIFSSPVYFRNTSIADYVLVGCHDKNLYCLTSKGKLNWSFTADSQIYSTPFVSQLFYRCGDENDWVVFVFSSSGTMYALDLSSGLTLSDPVSLPGEVFSSPVVVSNRVLIGCRDDYLYCLEQIETKNT